MNKEKEFWNNAGADLYESGKFDDANLSNYEFDLLKRHGIKSGEVLEIGPGTGRDLAKFKELGFKLNGIDISTVFIKDLKERFEGNFVEADLRDLDNNFSNIDLVYARWAIQFLSYGGFKDFLKNVSKVLKPGGHLMVSVRYGNSLSNIHKMTNLQSLQMNTNNLVHALPDDLEIIFTEVISYKSTNNSNDKQFTFMLRKKTKDDINNMYIK